MPATLDVSAPELPRAAPRSHRAYLDGLRALAALWVVLSHLWISQFGIYAQPGLLGWGTNWLLYSHLAVDVFIVLSGYCLMLPVAREGSLSGGAWAFFGRRARRILPPFYAALALSVFVFLLRQHLGHSPKSIDFQALRANIFLFQDLSPAWNVFNGPFWSIAVEWRIYFLFPLMVWIVRRWGQAPLLALAGLAGYSLTLCLLRSHPEMQQASPWYLFLFGLGICAAALPSSGKNINSQKVNAWFCGLSGLALAGMLWLHPVTLQSGADFGQFMPVTDAAAGAWMASLLSLLSQRERFERLRAVLSWKPLATLGTFAYSLYLVHMPCVLIFSDRLNFHWPMLDPLKRFGLLLVFGLPVILGLAYLFFLAFERPFLVRREIRLPSTSLR